MNCNYFVDGNYKCFNIENFEKKLNTVTKILKKACDSIGISYNLEGNIIKIFNNDKSIIFNGSRNFLNIENKKNTINKDITSKLLSKNNIPVPNNKVFNKIKSPKDLMNIIFNHNIPYPLVVKPNDGSGGKKVFVNIKNITEQYNILLNDFSNQNIKFSESKKIMIENYIEGNDFRILCYKNIILDVVKRSPPYVIGDGENTIKFLVDKQNKIKISNGHHKIQINELFLNKNNLNINSIIKLNEKIIVNPISNFHKGGFIERIPLTKIHQDNLEIFKKVNDSLGLQFCGIDFLVKDISKSYKTQICGINEVNSSPSFDIHYYADNKNSLEIPIKFLKYYFNL
jgi:cyanophycin synthetase